MRLPADGRTAAFARIAWSVALACALSACGALGGSPGASGGLQIAAATVTGPQADYPLVVGEPYVIGGVTHTPEDVMNYDQVGFVAADPAGGQTVSGSHHTLPLPSYVEVTSLETGRTILVRIERRGPMNGQDLLALSNGALGQLGAAPGSPVRVRRVNPPEEQRALLRAGGEAAPRMDTPMSLVEILKRKLPGKAAPAQPALAAVPTSLPPVTAVAVAPPPVSARSGPPPLPPLAATASPPPAPPAVARNLPPPAVASGDFVVQAAAFSTSDRAQSAARVLGGEVSRSGQYFRVRTGPFATRGEAEASLAKVRAAGYRDARIYTSG
jgi:rare lipoprotein A